MPQLHDASEELLDKLEAWKPTRPKRNWKPIHRNFQGSVFAATTFNFGPDVVCHAHRDHLNWVIGGCAITSGGIFDYTKGGHLVLIDLKLIFEFPPGSTIIIPSAMVTHANLPIAPHEHRISVTQYTAGGLFRFVDYGYRTAKTFLKHDRKGKGKKDRECEQRWAEQLRMYETKEEKRSD
ncbi:hypothetical protein BDZ97DRAFT_1650943 [Flammula alnicola]|nr:hypothetical protein BDZ97DRAFT_1650943 [Flammula alnicola]